MPNSPLRRRLCIAALLLALVPGGARAAETKAGTKAELGDGLEGFSRNPICCPKGTVCDHGICIEGKNRGKYCGAPDGAKSQAPAVSRQNYMPPPKVIWLPR